MLITKPVIFLDFDCTLFDLSRLMSEYFGFAHADHYPKMREMITAAHIPNLSAYLYHDVVPFLSRMAKTHHLVLVSRARTFPEYQRRKVLGSGVDKLLDKVLYSDTDEKGPIIKKILDQAPAVLRAQSVFIDDNIEALLSAKKEVPELRALIIDRRKIMASVIEPIDGVIHALADAFIKN